MTTRTTKTCIKYWGGKQQLADRIIDLIPSHFTYCEPFFGGGAVFFKKPPSKNEVINDIADNMVNFYKVLKRANDFQKLLGEVDVTLFAEHQYKEAKQLWVTGIEEDKIMRAWAVFVLSHQSFSGNIDSSWAHSNGKNQAKYWQRVKENFDKKYSQRLQATQIFCRDAVNVIQNMDDPNTFFFIDPPYIDTVQGSYSGYNKDQYEVLLKLLENVKGKFMLTTYPSEILKEYTKKNNWHTIENEMHLSASKTTGRKKIEVFTLNYSPEEESAQQLLF